jgi:diphthamide synthase (EF-2-diphthine--ammonia ligase)
MANALAGIRARGIETVAYGDLFLEDIRAYREATLARGGMRGLFPIWNRDTTELAHEVIRSGFRAYTSCVEGHLGPQFAGRLYDLDFLARLPVGTDPCGERGEFHSFVFDGPIFQEPVPAKVGEVVTRDGRFYADLLLPTSKVPVNGLAEVIPRV